MGFQTNASREVKTATNHIINSSEDDEPLLDYYKRVRHDTEHICAPLEIEDYGIQTVAEVSPPKWHLAHTSWFFETFLLTQFEPDDALLLLKEVASMVGKSGKMLIGVDLKKDHSILNAAYNDANGLTADFNLNLLHRMREELQAEIDISLFSHHAFYNNAPGRIDIEQPNH